MARGRAHGDRTQDAARMNIPLLDELDRQNARVVFDYQNPQVMTPPERWAAFKVVAPMLIKARLRTKVTKRLLGFLMPIAAYYVRMGLELTPDKLLSRATIENYLDHGGRVHSPEVRKNTVQAAGQLGRALQLAEYPPKFRQYAASAVDLPYTMWDWRFFISLAEQMSDAFSDEMCVMIDLCFGAGARAPQLDALLGTDVTDLTDRVAITMTVNGVTQQRFVGGDPADRIADQAARVQDNFLLRPNSLAKTRRNEVSQLTSTFARSSGFNFRPRLAADYWATELYRAARARASFDIVGYTMDGNKPFKLLGQGEPSTPEQRAALLERLFNETELF